MVEHNLAKVGVAGSNPVSRSTSTVLFRTNARVVELVDTPDLKSCALFGRAGSSPASSTKAPQTVGLFLSLNTCGWASTAHLYLSPGLHDRGFFLGSIHIL